MLKFENRKGTSCYKWDMKPKTSVKIDDLIPMWVADMDFRSPEPIIEALRKRLEHGVFGYTFAPPDYYESIASWWKDVHGIEIDPGWIVHVPGVVTGIAVSLIAFTDPGDGVILQPPVYWPFFETITGNSRKIVENPLEESDGYYSMDLNDLKDDLKFSRVLLLCNPHNPVGRVWKESEVEDLGDILKNWDGILISDEIHMDFVFKGKFHSALELESLHDRLVVLSSPNKTFNIPGLKGGYAIIPDDELRRRFSSTLKALHASSPNVFITHATVAAYEHGREWLEEVKEYISENFRKVVKTFESSKVRVNEPEGTYLMWLDFRKSGLENPFEDLLKAGVWLQDGVKFGRGGEGFLRMNVATSREILEEALSRIVRAFQI